MAPLGAIVPWGLVGDCWGVVGPPEPPWNSPCAPCWGGGQWVFEWGHGLWAGAWGRERATATGRRPPAPTRSRARRRSPAPAKPPTPGRMHPPPRDSHCPPAPSCPGPTGSSKWHQHAPRGIRETTQDCQPFCPNKRDDCDRRWRIATTTIQYLSRRRLDTPEILSRKSRTCRRPRRAWRAMQRSQSCTTEACPGTLRSLLRRSLLALVHILAVPPAEVLHESSRRRAGDILLDLGC